MVRLGIGRYPQNAVAVGRRESRTDRRTTRLPRLVVTAAGLRPSEWPKPTRGTIRGRSTK